mmetsp:Transcript_46701/g.53863  ORF Transcript_46701/g.53863 Transcript_46701/m.53863 type:complete len:270 (+) Transcript_46701:77-886(+)
MAKLFFLTVSALTLLALTHNVNGVWVPDNFDVRDFYPQCVDRIPYEGMCVGTWALVFADTLGNRYCMATGSKTGDLTLSGQDLFSCMDNPNGCYDFKLPVVEVLNHLKNKGVTTARCVPYTSGFRGAIPPCPTACDTDQNSAIIRYKADSSSAPVDLTTETVDQIQYEIAANGPIVLEYPRELLFVPGGEETGRSASERFGNLFGKILGWGLNPDTKEKFWIVQTAFGPMFGDEGIINLPFPDTNPGAVNSITYSYYRLQPAAAPTPDQ